MFDHTLPRCWAEQGMDWQRIKKRRTAMEEHYNNNIEPDEEEEIKKRDDEQKRDSLSSGQRKKVAGPDNMERLIWTLEATSTQTLEQSRDFLKFEKERHDEAMKLGRERLDLEARSASNNDTFKQTQLDQKQKELEIKERELALAQQSVTSNAQTMHTLTRVLAALAVPNTADA